MRIEAAIGWLLKFPAMIVTGVVDGIIAAMTGNPNYVTPVPALTVVSAANDAAKTAIANAVNGGREFTAIKDAKMFDLAAVVRPLGAYATTTADGDLAKLLSSGFPIKKPTNQPVGPLPMPTGPIAVPGDKHGKILAATDAIDGAYIYNWRMALASAPTVYVLQVQSTGANTAMEGLTRGGIYNVEVNAVGTAGTTEWSDAVSVVAP
jgi:hypothetical protein